MRSIVGMGMTPPKVLGTPNPASSVMIRTTFGAPFGGATRGGHQYFDCRAPSLITPPNFGSGAGSCLLLTVLLALGEPGVPVTCCACATTGAARITAALIASRGNAAFPRYRAVNLFLISLSSLFSIALSSL